jgi:hypothetical protein
MAILPGTRLGPYEVVSAIGAGGMGEIYPARLAKSPSLLAIASGMGPLSPLES